MVTLMNTFDNNVKSKFYELLSEAMYANNFMSKDTSFHPEIIALNENLTFSEFILKDPVF